jgi:imidazolonepropionase-like amidohydrolase
MRSLILALAIAGQPAIAQDAPPRERIAIVGADVLPMTATERLADQTVLIDGERIAAVGPRAGVSVPAGYRTIDARGKVLMPGLVDMHIHMSPAPGEGWDSTQRTLAISLANGVTTARVMSGAPTHPAVRASVESGKLAGPRLYLAAPAVADQNTPTAEAAREKIKAAKAAGFDLIKAHGIQQVPVWDAMSEEAARQGIAVAGHVTNAVGLKRALDARQQIEHLDSIPAEIMPADASRDFGQFLSGPELAVLDKVPDERFAEVARLVRSKQGHVVPTLAAFERIGEMERPFDSMLSGPDDDYVAAWVIDDWRARRSGLAEMGFTLEDSRGMAAMRRKITKALHDAGVPLMAGSDTPHPFQIWGFGMIREIEALRAAGLSNMAALRSATVVPRDYLRSLPGHGSALGWKAEFGTVEPGARADLLLLGADPSRDLAALKSIEAVVAGGRLYDSGRLAAMLREAAVAGKKQPAPTPGSP